VQLGITLGGFLASATAAVSIAAVFADRFTFLGDVAEPVSVIFVTLVLTYVTLVLGELVPKRVALKNPERWALRVARPLNMLATAARPIIWGLSKSTDLVASLFGGGKGGAGDSDDLLELIAYQPTLSPVRRKMLTRAYAMHERTVREIVVPRSKVMHILMEDSVEDALQKVTKAGHSRLPVLEDTEYSGFVHVLDLLSAPDRTVTAASLRRKGLIVPESATVTDVLASLQATRHQLAFVADEYGATTGILTVEDVIEEIVGEIYDEFDDSYSESDPRAIQRELDGSMTIPGAFPLHELPTVGIHVPKSSQSTVAGLIAQELQRIPVEGDAVTISEVAFTVLEVTDNRVMRVKVHQES
jgi:putative hemolysin